MFLYFILYFIYILYNHFLSNKNTKTVHMETISTFTNMKKKYLLFFQSRQVVIYIKDINGYSASSCVSPWFAI